MAGPPGLNLATSVRLGDEIVGDIDNDAYAIGWCGTMGNNRHQSGRPDTRTGSQTREPDGPLYPRLTREAAGNTLFSPLEQLPSHDHALDLVGAFVDLDDRGPVVRFP